MYSLLTLNVCTLLLFILFILSLINKLLLVKGLNLKIIDKILPFIKSEKLKGFIDSAYQFSDKVNIFYSIFIIIFIFISSLASIYFIYL